MDRRTIQRATRQRVREVIREEWPTVKDFIKAVVRSSIDLTRKGKCKMIVTGFDPLADWDVVEAEAAKQYKRLIKKAKGE